jgi:uncharacterized protein
MTNKWTELPTIIPVFPLAGALLLPMGQLPLNIFEPRYLKMVDDSLRGDRVIGMVQPREPGAPDSEPPVYNIGCAGRLTGWQEVEDGRCVITLTGIRRFTIMEELARTTPYRLFRVDYSQYEDDFEPQAADKADREEFLTLIRQYVDLQNFAVNWSMIENTDTETLIHASATLAPWAPSEKQALLEAPSVNDRYDVLIALYRMAIAHETGAGGTVN